MREAKRTMRRFDEIDEHLLSLLEKGGASYKPLYPVELPIKEKIEMIVKMVYASRAMRTAPVRVIGTRIDWSTTGPSAGR